MFLNHLTQEIRKTPTRLADILGTYVWVFSGDPEWGGDVPEMFHKGYPDDKAFIAQHSIMLGAAKHRPGRPVAPKDVSGHITWGTLKVAFDGVRGVRAGRSSNAVVIESYWEVLLTEDPEDDSESARWLDKEDNTVGAAVVLDDNGFPFLVFDWHNPPGGHSSWSGYYLGKRLVEGEQWRLTGEEEERLGIGASFRSVEQLVKEGSPGVYEEDFEDEEYFCRDADGSSGEEAFGEKMKASIDERGTKKRKASTDETGSKKRRKRRRRRA